VSGGFSGKNTALGSVINFCGTFGGATSGHVNFTFSSDGSVTGTAIDSSNERFSIQGRHTGLSFGNTFTATTNTASRITGQLTGGTTLSGASIVSGNAVDTEGGRYNFSAGRCD
jgi:hypothetical protein